MPILGDRGYVAPNTIIAGKVETGFAAFVNRHDRWALPFLAQQPISGVALTCDGFEQPGELYACWRR